MNGRERSWRQDRTLDALLTFSVLRPRSLHESVKVGEIAESFGVDRRLGADGQGLSDLGDDDTDLPRRYLYPGVLGDGVNQNELEP
jgi:hypothetical protein